MNQTKIIQSGFLLFEFIITLSVLMIIVLGVFTTLSHIHGYHARIKLMYHDMHIFKNDRLVHDLTPALRSAIESLHIESVT